MREQNRSLSLQKIARSGHPMKTLVASNLSAEASAKVDVAIAAAGTSE